MHVRRTVGREPCGGNFSKLCCDASPSRVFGGGLTMHVYTGGLSTKVSEYGLGVGVYTCGLWKMPWGILVPGLDRSEGLICLASSQLWSMVSVSRPQKYEFDILDHEVHVFFELEIVTLRNSSCAVTLSVQYHIRGSNSPSDGSCCCR